MGRLREPRLSIKEHYENHEGYEAAVKAAATKLAAAGFLLQQDAARLIDEAAKSDILK